MGRIVLSLVSTLFICQPAIRAQTCHVFGEKNAAATAQALHKAPSCKAAEAYLSKCAWGSSADVEFAGIVQSRCEKDFIQNLSPAQKFVYKDKGSLCADAYGQQDGTLALSEEATCIAGVAFQFATNLAEASRPVPQAGFDCLKAQSVIEITICTHAALGRQDLLMSRAYHPFLKAVTGADRKTLLDSQRAWNRNVLSACKLTSVPASNTVVSCLAVEYKARASVLDSCAMGLDVACIAHAESLNQH